MMRKSMKEDAWAGLTTPLACHDRSQNDGDERQWLTFFEKERILVLLTFY